MSNTDLSRRRFCAGACRAASGVALATIAGCAGGDSPTSPNNSGVTLGVSQGRFTGGNVEVAVAGTALNNVGGAVLVESTAGVFLVSRTADTTYNAIDAVCSHQSCTVTNADGDIYVCPCHGSRYDRNGRVVHGPATASLRRYSSSFANGTLTIVL
jgi:Rieske Fe-S protein